jgi:hypothetical protein
LIWERYTHSLSCLSFLFNNFSRQISSLIESAVNTG